MYGKIFTGEEINEFIADHNTEPWCIIGFLNAAYADLRRAHARLSTEFAEFKERAEPLIEATHPLPF